MSDASKVFYWLLDSWSDSDLEGVVDFFDTEYGIGLPAGFEHAETVRPASAVTRPSHYVDELRSGFGSIDIELPSGMNCGLLCDVPTAEDATAPDGPNLLVTVPEVHLRVTNGEEDAVVSDRVDELYDFLVAFYQFLCDSGHDPRYVYGLTGEDERRVADPDYSLALDLDRVERDQLPGVYWCQIVPPHIVAAVGVETLLTAPMYTAERLSDGSVFLALHGYPDEIADEQAVADHLGVPYGTLN